MANEKDSKQKNTELLNPNKDTQEERLAAGAKGRPKEGQTWAEINKGGRVDIKKPDIYYDASKKTSPDNQKGKETQKDKETDKDPEKDPEKDK